jgi:uncharacterized membrane protein/thiol-disulfide isomerase/thioredoxin
MAQTFDTKLPFVAYCFVKQLKVKVTQTTLTKSIEENAYYPSLLSLSDALTRFKIPNNAYEVDTDNFGDLQAPFIAYANLPGTGSDFVLVTAVTAETISYLYGSKKPITVSKTDFLQQFKNVVLIADPVEESGEPDYGAKLAQEQAATNKKTLWAAGVAILLLLAVTANITGLTALAFCVLRIIKFTGLAAAILLLALEINKNNAFVKNICSAGGKTNCDAVLGSKAAKIWGISWGEIGFFYFASTTLLLLTPVISFVGKTAIISITNALAAPYIVFSVYYQWRVAKQWCPLCLTVQAVLAAELVWSMFNFWLPALHSPMPMSNYVLLTDGGWMGAALGVPILAWYGLKPIFTKAKDYQLYYNAYKRLQYNPETFNSQLMQQPKAAESWQRLGITIGNPRAENTIIKVCNPYCGPCAKAHPKLEELIHQNNNVNLKIIFTARNNEHDRSAAVVKHLLAVAAEGNSLKTQQALDDWYLADKKDYQAFAIKYPMNGELTQQDNKVEAMDIWCRETEIMHTPTIFVNGYRLPENYNVEELKYIL